MLIDLKYLQNKYNLKLYTVVHVGAHNAEELKCYKECGVIKTFWVEGNGSLAASIKEKLDLSNNIVIEAVVSDKDGDDVVFNVANNTQASSILDLGTHKDLFPTISYVTKETKKTKTLDSILNNYYKEGNIDLLNLDIQGAEYKALKGLTENLDRVSCIYSEINTEEVYKDCGLMSEIDDFLSKFKFKRVETKMWSNHPWGDAFYIKDK